MREIWQFIVGQTIGFLIGFFVGIAYESQKKIILRENRRIKNET